jgi:hypothetical protein
MARSKYEKVCGINSQSLDREDLSLGPIWGRFGANVKSPDMGLEKRTQGALGV